MAIDADRAPAEEESPHPAEKSAKRAGRQGLSWVDRIYDVIDERIGEAMKRLSE